MNAGLLVRPHMRHVKLHYVLLLASNKLVIVSIPAKNYISNEVSYVCANTFPFKHGNNLPHVSGFHSCLES